METCRTSLTEAVCTSSWSVCTRSLDPWRRSGSAAGPWSAWALCSSSSSTLTPTTAVCAPAGKVVLQTSQQLPLFYPSFLFSLFSADSFETMLKSLLGYQSGMGGRPTETVIRKKVYQSAINNTLKNNFPLVLKVGVKVGYGALRRHSVFL